jgi:hypothetical protein
MVESVQHCRFASTQQHRRPRHSNAQPRRGQDLRQRSIWSEECGEVRVESEYESLFRVWGTAWGRLWKTVTSPLFAMPVNPWGATNLSAAQIGTEVPEEQVKGFER